MKRYIALLRGVNISGKNKISMPELKVRFIELAEKYIAEEKADAMLLACTELPLAIKPGDVSVPVLNTTEIHINAICRKAGICT